MPDALKARWRCQHVSRAVMRKLEAFVQEDFLTEALTEW
jgi:hypothetical protein